MNRGKEVLVGAVILAGIAVTAVGTLWLKGINFGRPAVPIDVLVQDVGQLREGNAVKFRGVQIGRVESFEVVPDGEAVRIRLRLENDMELPTDAVAIVAPESLFGEWQTEIVSRARFPTFDYFVVPPRLEEEGVRVLGGFAIPDISRLTATANEISQNLAVLTNRVDRAFNDSTADNFRQAIDNIQQVSENLRDLVGQQASTFANVSAQVERAATEIGGAAEVGRSALQHADRILASGEVDSILVNVRTATGTLSSIAGQVAQSTDEFDQTLRRADSAFARIDRLTARVSRGEGAIGQLFADTVLVSRAGAVLRQLDLLLADLRENPKRYVRLSIF